MYENAHIILFGASHLIEDLAHPTRRLDRESRPEERPPVLVDEASSDKERFAIWRAVSSPRRRFRRRPA